MIKILLLNGGQKLDLSSLGYESEITTEDDLGNSKFYEAPDDVLKKINDMTTSQEVDLVVIRHAISGAGLLKVRAVDLPMLPRIVVIFHGVLPSKQCRKPYQELGVTNFSSTLDVVPFLENFIGNEAKCQDALKIVEC